MRDERLEAAYRATRYVATRPARDGGSESVCIRIGMPCAALDVWLDDAQVAEWAFVTACNPRSRVLSPEENRVRMAALVVDLGVIGWPMVHGLGEPEPAEASQANWTAEPSVLVLGLSRAVALELAERYEQNAFVYGRRGGVAELVWTSHHDGLM